MEGIIDYRCDDSVAFPKMDKYITTSRGQRRLHKTTAGWKLLVKWRDQIESWVKLSELKESHPMDTAEFAKLRRIDNKPGFAWWVLHTLKERNAIIAMKVRLRTTTHKYGIEIPTSVDHAMEIDRKNGNTMWKDALALEMFNVGVAFEIFEYGQMAPPPPPPPDKLSKGDLKKACGRLGRHWNPKTREDKVQFYTKFLNYKLENVKQRPMDWLAFME